MSRLADTLIRALGDKLTPTDKRDIKRGFSVLEGTAKDLGASVGSGGRGSRISSGSVVMGVGDGIKLFNPRTGYNTVGLTPRGDFIVGYDVERPAYTSLLVQSNDVYYNGETLGFGDVLLGDNTSGAANLHWDRSTGRLNFRGGTTVNAYIDSDGYLTATGATITGTITAAAGAIGGWSLTSKELVSQNSNILLDSLVNTIYVSDGDVGVYLDGNSGTIYSENYSAGVSGWMVGGDDSAEFENIVARGEIKSAVFTAAEIQATGGTFAVTKAVGKLHTNFTTPVGNEDIQISNDGGGSTCSFANNDIVRIKTGTTDYWGKLTNKFQAADYASYTCTTQSGTTGAAIKAGQAIVGYDPTAGGSIYLNANSDSVLGEAANMSIISHTTSPWSDETLLVRIGNLYGSYGAGYNNRYGFGVGDYSVGNYISYNADGSGAFVISAADGGVVIDEGYINIFDPGAGYGGVSYYYDDSGTPRLQGIMWGDSDASSSYLWIQARRDSGVPWTSKATAIFSAYDSITGISTRLTLTSLKTAAFTSVDTLTTDGDIKFTGGLAVGSTSFTPNAGDIIFNGNAVCLVDGSSAGYYAGATNDVQWYRGGSDLWQTPDSVEVGGNIKLDGNLYTIVWQNYFSSSTVVGWSSTSTGAIRYIRVGRLVYVIVYINGTSNSTSTSFTLPYTVTALAPTVAVQFTDNGTSSTTPGSAVLGAGSSTVNVYTDWAGAGWTASGNKNIKFEFFYYTTDTP